ncbi:MAG: EAL and HDOD domain-containing protein [Oceanobacter sp.]
MAAFNDLGIEIVTGGLPAFVNFTRYWLESPPVLGHNLIVAEILEHLEHDETLLQCVKKLKKDKFRVALDDYTGQPLSDALLDLLDIIKVDLPFIESLEEISSRIQEYQRPNLKWLAEKVETQEQFEACKEAGFHLFQGYFYAKPNELYGRRQSDNQITVMSLLSLLADPEVEVDAITDLLQSDPELSFKLIKFANSAYPLQHSEITSIHKAIVAIGIQRIKAWSNVLALGRLDNKPAILRQQALVRAEFSRSLALLWKKVDPEQAFTVGLFSMLDAFFDISLEELCKQMKLAKDMQSALIEREGELGNILAIAEAMEKGDWKGIPWPLLESKNIDTNQFPALHKDAIESANMLLGAAI